MSAEQAVDYELVERDLNLEPEKFHRIKQAFRVLIGLPVYLAVKMKERILTWNEKRKERKAEKKAIKAEKKARRLAFWKAIAQNIKRGCSHIITVSKNWKHEWAMAGMSEEEKEQYKIEHGLVEPTQTQSNPVPQTPNETPLEKPADTTPSNETPAVSKEQGAYTSYIESSKTVTIINEQIRSEIEKGSAADFELIAKYREQLKIEELNRDNHLEAYLSVAKAKDVVQTAPAEEKAPEEKAPRTVTPRVSNKLHLGSAAQRVARRSLIARGTPEIVNTMKSGALKVQKTVVSRAKKLMERAQLMGDQILHPIEEPEVATGLAK